MISVSSPWTNHHFAALNVLKQPFLRQATYISITLSCCQPCQDGSIRSSDKQKNRKKQKNAYQATEQQRQAWIPTIQFFASSTIYHTSYSEQLNQSKFESYICNLTGWVVQIFCNSYVRVWESQPFLPVKPFLVMKPSSMSLGIWEGVWDMRQTNHPQWKCDTVGIKTSADMLITLNSFSCMNWYNDRVDRYLADWITV